MQIVKVRKALLVSLIGCFISSTALAEIVIIVHPNNDSVLDTKTVQRLFLGKAKKFPNGQEAIPINQSDSSSTRSTFDTNTLNRSSSQVSAYWSKLVFTGKGTPPKEVDDDNAVIDLVSKNQNAIGYIDSSTVNDTVKTIPIN